MTEPKKILTTRQAAKYLRLAEQTLASYRFYRKPPSYVKYGRRVFYELSELDKFIESHRIILNS